ncbi:fungal-specific transcription factor domain-containing protein [Aspergillus crustosus]
MSTISRVRTGCWTCRDRRIKCDETRPVCRRCERLNIACGYGVRLIWHDESIARGVCHGREAVWSKRKHTSPRRPSHKKEDEEGQQLNKNCESREWMFLNTSNTDLEIYFNLQPKSEGLETELLPLYFSPALTTLPSTSRYQYDSALLSYFDHIICSSSTLVDDAHCNPYRHLILPMAMSSAGLYHATLAIAASTLRLSNSSYRLPALEHHHRALGHLRTLLAQDEWDDTELDEMTGLVLMLCWFEISNRSSPSWVTHLNGYQDLLHARQQRPTRSAHSEQLSSFFNRYFAFHFVLARTAFGLDQSTFQLSDTLSPTDDPDLIDPYMGLSHSLLLLINQIAGMAMATDKTTAASLLQQLHHLQQHPPLHNNNTTTNTQCIAIAEANRLGAVLLLHEVYSPTTTTSRRSTSTPTQNLPTLDPTSKPTYVRQILSLITTNRKSMLRTAALPLWPLFLAGCCAREDEERMLVMQLFEELEGRRRFGNIAPAMEVVQMVWRQRDLAAQDERKKTGADGRKRKTDQSRFEWERAMRLMGGWKLSLT